MIDLPLGTAAQPRSGFTLKPGVAQRAQGKLPHQNHLSVAALDAAGPRSATAQQCPRSQTKKLIARNLSPPTVHRNFGIRMNPANDRSEFHRPAQTRKHSQQRKSCEPTIVANRSTKAATPTISIANPNATRPDRRSITTADLKRGRMPADKAHA